MQATEPTKFRLVYLFDLPSVGPITDLKHVLSDVQSLAGHIPLSWSIEAEDREFLSRLHQNVTLHGRTIVVFSLDEMAPAGRREHCIELLANIAKSKSFRKWMLASGVVSCLHGFGGDRDGTLKQLQDLQRQHFPQDACSGASRSNSPRPVGA
jgi:hypothetical protein